MKLSKWFKHPKRPDLIGWYEVRGLHIRPGLKLLWNGKRFGFYDGWRWINFPDCHGDAWRGLAEKPHEDH
jgi:hypothetical protein